MAGEQIAFFIQSELYHDGASWRVYPLVYLLQDSGKTYTMTLPDILIVADYKKFFVYMILPDGLPEIINSIDFEKDGQTSVPVVNWEKETEGYRTIAECISTVLARYQPSKWGLACPQALIRGMSPWLPSDQMTALEILRQMNVDHVDISNVAKVFDHTAPDYNAEKEHC